MRVVHYCQHILGMGHFFRSLEIDKALKEHEVTLVTGGSPLSVTYPEHLQVVELPPLSMDTEFNAFVTYTDDGTAKPLTADDLSVIQWQRTTVLMETLQQLQPDIFLVELFPFGRKQFSFELMPVLEKAKRAFPQMYTVSSVRDILVEKDKQQRYEERVISILNTHFDGVLVHTDPHVVTLQETFSRTQDITPPLFNTGYITPKPHCKAPEEIRAQYSIPANQPFILGSIGSGSVHPELMVNLVKASIRLQDLIPHTLLVTTGPFMDTASQQKITALSRTHEHIRVTEFIPNFVDHLSAADLSVSMAGYNTTMNLLAVNTFGLVFPFDQNREQRLRSTHLEKIGAVKILEKDDIAPTVLCSLLQQYLTQPPPQRTAPVDLGGAENTVRMLEQLLVEHG